MTSRELNVLDDLLAVDAGLSGREIDFITDLDDHWRDRSLSDKQCDWLDAIAERVL